LRELRPEDRNVVPQYLTQRADDFPPGSLPEINYALLFTVELEGRTIDITAEEIGAVLSGRQLAINELGEELAERIAGRLSPAQRTTWQATGPYGANSPLGEGVRQSA